MQPVGSSPRVFAALCCAIALGTVGQARAGGAAPPTPDPGPVATPTTTPKPDSKPKPAAAPKPAAKPTPTATPTPAPTPRPAPTRVVTPPAPTYVPPATTYTPPATHTVTPARRTTTPAHTAVKKKTVKKTVKKTAHTATATRGKAVVPSRVTPTRAFPRPTVAVAGRSDGGLPALLIGPLAAAALLLLLVGLVPAQFAPSTRTADLLDRSRAQLVAAGLSASAALLIVFLIGRTSG